MARWRRRKPSPLDATLALAVVGVCGSFLASFGVIWLLDVVSPTEKHPAVVAFQSAEEREYRRRRGGLHTSTEYHNLARDLDGELIAFASNSLLGDEVQRNAGIGDPVVLSVSRLTGRVTTAEFVDKRIDLRFHVIMLVAVGFSTTMGVATGFGTIGLWRRSPTRYRTPVLLAAATVGAGVGGWGLLIRENAVEGDVADAIEVPTDVVAFGSTAGLADWTITLMAPVDAPANPATDEILEHFDLVAVDLEVTYRGTATQVVTGSPGDGLFNRPRRCRRQRRNARRLGPVRRSSRAQPLVRRVRRDRPRDRMLRRSPRLRASVRRADHGRHRGPANQSRLIAGTGVSP